MYKREKLTVHLGLYGKTAAKTVRLLFEGLRERIDYREKKPLLVGRHFTGESARVVVDATGEVTLQVDKDNVVGTWAKYNQEKLPSSAFAKGLDVSYVKAWLAEDLRMRVKGMECSETFRLHPASKTSQTSKAWEAYATADALGGATEEDIDVKYGKGTGAKVLGSAADPIKTEINEVVAEEVKRIKKEYDRLRADKHMEMLGKIAPLRREYRSLVAEIGKQERAAVTKMKKEMLAA